MVMDAEISTIYRMIREHLSLFGIPSYMIVLTHNGKALDPNDKSMVRDHYQAIDYEKIKMISQKLINFSNDLDYYYRLSTNELKEACKDNKIPYKDMTVCYILHFISVTSSNYDLLVVR